MSDPIISDRAMRAAQTALDGLAQRQEVIGHNLANVDTPGYKAQTVDFGSALRQALHTEAGPQPVALQTTQPGHIVPSPRVESGRLSLRQGGSLRADGNNVDIDVELAQMAETGIQYQAISQLVSKKLLLLKNVITGR